MKSEHKAKLVTVLIFALLCLLFSDVVAIWPKSLPWILGAFALPGAWKFCRVLYIWLITEDTPLEIEMPKLFRKKNKHEPNKG